MCVSEVMRNFWYYYLAAQFRHAIFTVSPSPQFKQEFVV